MQRILIPTDFSENSWNALIYGLELFKKEPCTFYLLNISPIPPYSGSGSSVKVMIEDKVLVEAKRSLQILRERIDTYTKNKLYKFVTLANYDFFVDGIKREVKEKKIDLIIMGTKGASGLKKATMGSNTGDVITKVQCPLLAVPENTRYKPPREIAFPTDYHIGYDLKVLDTLIYMAQIHASAIRIVHISKKGEVLTKEQEKNKEFLNDYLRGLDHTFHSLTGTKIEAAIQCFIESRDVDMVAMVAKHINFFQRILFKPKVEEISYHTDVPFLVLHE